MLSPRTQTAVIQFAQQRAASVELEDQRRQVQELTQSKKQIQAELADLKDKLEVEMMAKNEETNIRRQLQARLQELELQGVEGGDGDGAGRDAVEDEVLLRLRVYRSLGIDVERDERDGEFARAVVRETIKSSPKRYVSLGGNSRLFWLLGWFPRTIVLSLFWWVFSKKA